ncbi:hypothetical protein SLS62_002141 [Diatrype stigma]|uniref:Putative lipoate-protein ligase A n=1 Tax=Diatrype stigma TaxID=117547 RepID=A0AAN9YVY9_9PEZI
MLRLLATRSPARSARAKPPLPPPSYSRLFSSSSARQAFSPAAVSEPTNRVQMYISRSVDPYLNLSVEHYLLEKSPPDSVVLFLYTNRPCVVVGRNQNPWLEVNLGLVRRAPPVGSEAGLLEEDEVVTGEEGMPLTLSSSRSSNGSIVDLVRRRSGGGTVFHDLGNCNYSVLCPPADFDRNKHAEMVVRALRKLGASATRVNERHDIVLDVSAPASAAGERDPNPDQQQEEKKETFKISGSAYKLTRKRALHHGTCLLASPNLGPAVAGRLLRSPAEPYVKARGVASVRSPIRNAGVPPPLFQSAVVDEFRALYGGGGSTGKLEPEIVDAREALLVPELAKGYEELKTPQFTLSTHPTADDPRPRPPLPDYLPRDFRAEMTVRHGQITAVSGSGAFSSESLVSTYLHEVDDWRLKVGDEHVGRWLNGLLGAGPGDMSAATGGSR